MRSYFCDLQSSFVCVFVYVRITTDERRNAAHKSSASFRKGTSPKEVFRQLKGQFREVGAIDIARLVKKPASLKSSGRWRAEKSCIVFGVNHLRPGRQPPGDY